MTEIKMSQQNSFDVENFGAIPLHILTRFPKMAERMHKVRESVLGGAIAFRVKFPEYNVLTREDREELMQYGWMFDVDRMGKALVGLSDSKKIEYKRWKMKWRIK